MPAVLFSQVFPMMRLDTCEEAMRLLQVKALTRCPLPLQIRANNCSQCPCSPPLRACKICWQGQASKLLSQVCLHFLPEDIPSRRSDSHDGFKNPDCPNLTYASLHFSSPALKQIAIALACALLEAALHDMIPSKLEICNDGICW